MFNRAPKTLSPRPRRANSHSDQEPALTRERRSRPWYLYGLATAAVVIALLAATQIGLPASSARTSTQTVMAENGVVQSIVSGTGNVEPGAEVDVNFQASGTISKVYVTQGQHVTKGQLLATLDSTSAQLAVDQAEQTLTAADDQLSTAESASTTTSTTTTPSSGSSSQSDSSSAGSVASAQAAVDGAQASLDSAETALSNTKLYAPISGTIASLDPLSPGDSVSAGTTGDASASSSSGTGSSTSSAAGTTAGSLGSSGSSATSSSTSSPFAEIVNSSTMSMTVALSESDITQVKVGQAANVTLDALTGVELGAHVTAISSVGTDSDGVVSYDVTLTLDQTNSKVKAGMSASASVIVGQAQGINIPNAAITGTGQSGTVTLLKNGKKTQQRVTVGLRGENRTQILSGLSAGDEVVITTVLPPITSSSTTSSSSSGTLGGSTGASGGFGGGAGFPGGAAGFAGARGGAGAAG